jgi:hypothetical protein
MAISMTPDDFPTLGRGLATKEQWIQIIECAATRIHRRVLMADDMEKNRQQGGQTGQSGQSGQHGSQPGQHGQGQTGGQQSGQNPQKKGGQGTEEDENESSNRQRRAS